MLKTLTKIQRTRFKKLVQGKDNGIFYENEKESIEEVLKAFGIAAGVGLGARSGFEDGDEISLRFGEIFEEDHNPPLHENPISKITRPLTSYIIQLNDYDTWILTKQSVRNCTIFECNPQSSRVQRFLAWNHSPCCFDYFNCPFYLSHLKIFQVHHGHGQH